MTVLEEYIAKQKKIIKKLEAKAKTPRQIAYMKGARDCFKWTLDLLAEIKKKGIK